MSAGSIIKSCRFVKARTPERLVREIEMNDMKRGAEHAYQIIPWNGQLYAFYHPHIILKSETVQTNGARNDAGADDQG